MAEDADNDEARLKIIERNTIRDGLDALKALCKVLGLSLEQKLEVIGELGDGVDEKTKADSIKALKSTLWPLERLKKSRFEQIRSLGKEIISEWGGEPNSTILKIPEIFSIMDALNSEDVTEPGVLSTTFLGKVIAVRNNLDAAKEKTEYQAVKKELMGYLASSHLLEPTFDPAKKFDTENLPAETERLRAMIERIEAMVAEFESQEGELLFDGVSIRQRLEDHRKSLSAAAPPSAAAQVTLTSSRLTRSSCSLDGAGLASHPADIRHPTKCRSNTADPSAAPPPHPSMSVSEPVATMPDDPTQSSSNTTSSAPVPPPLSDNLSEPAVNIPDEVIQK